LRDYIGRKAQGFGSFFDGVEVGSGDWQSTSLLLPVSYKVFNMILTTF